MFGVWSSVSDSVPVGIAVTALVMILVFIGLSLSIRKRRKKTQPKSQTETGPKHQTPNTKLPTAAPIPVSPWHHLLSKTRDRWFHFDETQKNYREQLEEALLGADVGFKAAQDLLNEISWTVEFSQLKKDLAAKLEQKLLPANLAEWPAPHAHPHVILFVGVNGVGKTTSLAKLAQELKLSGRSVLLAAGDTFRAAAAEQLKQWAAKLDIPIISGGDGADSSAVLFDAVKSGTAKNVDFILCDSAGRLHNNEQLMENLAKNKRVLEKAMPGAPQDIVLVLDANTGQNMTAQARKFLELGVTGLILTKIDGSAKGGAILPLVLELNLPIVRVGTGEGEADLIKFSPADFSKSLLGVD